MGTYKEHCSFFVLRVKRGGGVVGQFGKTPRKKVLG
jgi:hypothetical protein